MGRRPPNSLIVMQLRKLAMARGCENADSVRHMGCTITYQDVVEYLNIRRQLAKTTFGVLPVLRFYDFKVSFSML